jgi:hydrogenase maturation protease
VARIVIFGYGNPLRGDDGFGWRTAERLRAEIRSPEVEVMALHQLTPELMEPISCAELAIFIDASVPQSVRRPGGGSAFTHHLTPQMLVEGARSLYGRAAEPLLLTTEGENFELGEELSPAVEAAVEQTLAKVRAILQRDV